MDSKELGAESRRQKAKRESLCPALHSPLLKDDQENGHFRSQPVETVLGKVWATMLNADKMPC